MMLSNPGVIDLKTSGPVASHQCPSHKLGTGRYDIAETYRFIPLRRLNWANIVFLWQTLLGVSLRVTQTLLSLVGMLFELLNWANISVGRKWWLQLHTLTLRVLCVWVWQMWTLLI
jgi:hypothetical protein